MKKCMISILILVVLMGCADPIPVSFTTTAPMVNPSVSFTVFQYPQDIHAPPFFILEVVIDPGIVSTDSPYAGSLLYVASTNGTPHSFGIYGDYLWFLGHETDKTSTTAIGVGNTFFDVRYWPKDFESPVLDKDIMDAVEIYWIVAATSPEDAIYVYKNKDSEDYSNRVFFLSFLVFHTTVNNPN